MISTNADGRPLAWLNNPAVKNDAVTRMRRHAELDQFISGNYLREDPDTPGGWRGCFHGCLTAEVYAAQRQLPLPLGAAADGLGAADRTGTRRLTPAGWHYAAEELFGIPHNLGKFLDYAYELFAGFRLPGVLAEFAVAVTEAIPVGADLWQIDVGALWSRRWVSEDIGVILTALRDAPVPHPADLAEVSRG